MLQYVRWPKNFQNYPPNIWDRLSFRFHVPKKTRKAALFVIESSKNQVRSLWFSTFPVAYSSSLFVIEELSGLSEDIRNLRAPGWNSKLLSTMGLLTMDYWWTRTNPVSAALLPCRNSTFIGRWSQTPWLCYLPLLSLLLVLVLHTLTRWTYVDFLWAKKQLSLGCSVLFQKLQHFHSCVMRTRNCSVLC